MTISGGWVITMVVVMVRDTTPPTAEATIAVLVVGAGGLMMRLVVSTIGVIMVAVVVDLPFVPHTVSPA